LSALRLDNAGFSPILQPVAGEFSLGRMIGVVGPNGAGKSTLLRIVAGIWKPTSGSVTLDGKDLVRLSARRRAVLLSFMPQQIPDDILFTAGEFVEMGMYAHRGVWGRIPAPSRRRLADIIAEFRLESHRDTPLSRLSGGERQRAAVARCVAQGSPVILLDEPIASLDLEYQLGILRELSRLANNGHLVMLSIHHLELAAKFCDELILLSHGALYARGDPRSVLTERSVEDVFHVQARIFPDPFSRALRISVDDGMGYPG
jgi:ABC-type cobalamin/Fe3+-siderophores transport system ATPase subunit